MGWTNYSRRLPIDLMKTYNALLTFNYFSPFLVYNCFSYSVSLPPFPKNNTKEQNTVVQVIYVICNLIPRDGCWKKSHPNTDILPTILVSINKQNEVAPDINWFSA